MHFHFLKNRGIEILHALLTSQPSPEIRTRFFIFSFGLCLQVSPSGSSPFSLQSIKRSFSSPSSLSDPVSVKKLLLPLLDSPNIPFHPSILLRQIVILHNVKDTIQGKRNGCMSCFLLLLTRLFVWLFFFLLSYQEGEHVLCAAALFQMLSKLKKDVATQVSRFQAWQFALDTFATLKKKFPDDPALIMTWQIDTLESPFS
jgi:hypothetical protein